MSRIPEFDTLVIDPSDLKLPRTLEEPVDPIEGAQQRRMRLRAMVDRIVTDGDPKVIVEEPSAELMSLRVPGEPNFVAGPEDQTNPISIDAYEAAE